MEEWLYSGFELETGADSYFMVYGLKVSIQSMSKYIYGEYLFIRADPQNAASRQHH